jgi:hypothetical protein
MAYYQLAQIVENDVETRFLYPDSLLIGIGEMDPEKDFENSVDCTYVTGLDGSLSEGEVLALRALEYSIKVICERIPIDNTIGVDGYYDRGNGSLRIDFFSLAEPGSGEEDKTQSITIIS